jgi:hypothetical protein
MQQIGYQHTNRILFTKGKQTFFLISIMRNRKLSQRKFATLLGTNRRTLRNWIDEISLLPENILRECLKISPESKIFLQFVKEKLPSNWGQMKGGTVRSKMKTNLNDKLRKKAFKMSKLQTKTRRVIGPKGEKMYNEGEKIIAECLTENNIDYKYEPLLNLSNKYFFPDFLVDNIIIERCGYSNWDGYWEKALKKFQYYDKFFSGKIIMVISAESLKVAYKKVKKVLENVENIIIIKENDIELSPRFIMGL